MRFPEDVAAEQAFLGALLLDASCVAAARAQITPEMLSRGQHRAIYEAILDLGDAADALTVTRRIDQAGKLEDVGGAVYVSSLMNAVPTARHWDTYADVICETYLQRRIQALGPEVEALATERPVDALAKIRSIMRDIEKSVPERSRVVALEDRLPGVWEDIQKRATHEDVPGIPYGFPKLDRATGGMMPGEFILVNGVTGTGKSALLQHFWECAGQRGPALVCTNEMTVLQYAQRELARRARVDVMNLRHPRYLTHDEEQRLSRAMGEVAEVRNRYFVAEGAFTIDAVRAAIEDVRDRAGGCVWVGIDWLQLLRGDRRARDGRTAELDTIVQEIQELAVTYAVPTVVVSQYDKISSRAGDLSPLGSRGSGMIAYTASVSVAVQYDAEDETALQRAGRIVITKSRMGPRVEERVLFEGAFVTFRQQCGRPRPRLAVEHEDEFLLDGLLPTHPQCAGIGAGDVGETAVIVTSDQRRTGVPRDRRCPVRTLPLISPREGGWKLSGSNIQQTGPHSWAVYAYAGVDDTTKRPIRKYLGTFPSKRDAERFRVELAHHPLYSAMIGPAGSPQLRLEKYVTTWIDQREALGKIRPHTAAGYRDRARLDIFPSIGHVPVGRISPPMIQGLYTRLLTERGLAPATVKQAASIIHASLRDAVRQGIIMKNPAAQCTTPSVPDHREMEVWTQEHLDKYLTDAAATATPSVFAFYTAMVDTSCRPGELAGASEDAIDFERGMLRVRTSLVSPGRKPVFDHPKTPTGHRAIKLSPEALLAIRAAILWKKQQRLRLGPKFQDGGTLFCTPRGRPLDRRVLRARDHLPRIKRLGLPDARIYDLRHLNITYTIAAGVDIRTVADRAGHKDPGYLIRRHAHAVAAAQERAVAVSSNLIAKSVGLAR